MNLVVFANMSPARDGAVLPQPAAMISIPRRDGDEAFVCRRMPPSTPATQGSVGENSARLISCNGNGRVLCGPDVPYTAGKQVHTQENQTDDEQQYGNQTEMNDLFDLREYSSQSHRPLPPRWGCVGVFQASLAVHLDERRRRYKQRIGLACPPPDDAIVCDFLWQAAHRPIQARIPRLVAAR